MRIDTLQYRHRSQHFHIPAPTLFGFLVLHPNISHSTSRLYLNILHDLLHSNHTSNWHSSLIHNFYHLIRLSFARPCRNSVFNLFLPLHAMVIVLIVWSDKIRTVDCLHEPVVDRVAVGADDGVGWEGRVGRVG